MKENCRDEVSIEDAGRRFRLAITFLVTFIVVGSQGCEPLATTSECGNGIVEAT